MKMLVKVFGSLLILSLLTAVTLYFQDTYFWKRYYLIATSKGVLPQSGWEGSEFQVKGDHHHFYPVVESSARTISQTALEQVESFAAQRNTTSLLVWHRGQLQLKQYYGDTNDDTLIVGKSMAKMVAGIVIARAIKDGYIAGLDEPAATYITEWQGTEKATITLRNMLHMAAGFEKYYTLDMSPFSNFTRSYIAGYTEDVLINGYELVNKPGTKYDYSQAVSDLLAIIIQRATGQPYGEYLSQALIQPIHAQGGEVMLNRPDGLAHSGCCLLLPAESWLRIGLFLLNSGEVNGEALFPDNWMQDYLAPSPSNPAMGLHIWLGKPYLPKRSWSEVGTPTGFGVLHSEPYLADDLFMFDGSGNQVIYIIPSKQLVIVRTGGFSWAPGKEWDNAFIPNTLIRGIKDDDKI
ncbi:serine hydrolase [Alteromonas sp. C1M14]|uniref:serine hydrolase domain-containing protein n=1 Tax=Alteromonas sp. C1M14 TaxID=2841567 RepID=UPI001C08D221|nr:serine hydrolase [Alteromonas sp. C1M14]MBU2980010.1 beta-lactamase family protein [Alteromonas sp. C1M14]